MGAAIVVDVLRGLLGRKIIEEDEAAAAPLRGIAVTADGRAAIDANRPGASR